MALYKLSSINGYFVGKTLYSFSSFQACMLTFYPEFEASVSDNFEVVFLLDLSNSMKGNSLLEAKKILLLSLFHLPESCFFNVIVFGTGNCILDLDKVSIFHSVD